MTGLPWRSLLALLLLLFSTACGTALRCGADDPSRTPANFDVVLGPGGLPVLYRGGQPHTCGELESLRALGVKSILKLNACGSRESDEERKAKALGFRVLSLDFNALNIGTSSTCSKVGEALAFLKDPDNVPVFVHCAEGKDRTGYIVGLYEKTFLHTPTADVLSELHCHGHRGLLRSLFMGQIPRELAREVPACSTSIPSRSEMTGGRGPDS